MNKNIKIIKYTAIKIFHSKKNQISVKLVKNNYLDLTQIKKNYVVIKVKYSNLNYKDFLMAKGHSGLVKKYPHIPGIDASGEIIYSNSKKFNINQKIFVVAKPLGVETYGSLAEYITVPDSWVEKIPKYTNNEEILSLGTSGFTAIHALEKSYKTILRNRNKPVLVSGATGNVGLILIHLLKNLNIDIEAITSNIKNISILKKNGVNKVYLMEKFCKVPNFAMLNEKYSVIFDNLGGEMISISSKYLIKKGILISIGNVLGNFSNINILPLILRGISILGLNTESLDRKERIKILEKLKLKNLKKLLRKNTKKINLIEVPKILNKKKFNKKFKRYLVKI